MYCTYVEPQSRQSAKLFLNSSELGLPRPLTRWGHTLWYSLYIHTLCVQPNDPLSCFIALYSIPLGYSYVSLPKLI
jgi:hypothetical protein